MHQATWLSGLQLIEISLNYLPISSKESWRQKDPNFIKKNNVFLKHGLRIARKGRINLILFELGRRSRALLVLLIVGIHVYHIQSYRFIFHFLSDDWRNVCFDEHIKPIICLHWKQERASDLHEALISNSVYN